MTTTENPTDAATDAAEAPETQAAPEAEATPKGNREARYRVERNEAREALAQAQARIEALQTRELHRLAGEHLAQPEDLLTLGGVELAELLDEDGNVGPEAVAEAAAALVETRPGLAKNPRVLAVDSTQGQGGNPGKPPAGWEALFER